MKTASFFTFQGRGRVSIARFAPRGTPAGFRGFRALAPGSWFNSVSETEYVKRFNEEILGPIDPKATWEALHALHEDGVEPVLLCWEKPTDPNSWCHRALVAAWFEKTLGVHVPEHGYEDSEHPLMPLRKTTKKGQSGSLFGGT
jgi:hypothetical protein